MMGQCLFWRDNGFCQVGLKTLVTGSSSQRSRMRSEICFPVKFSSSPSSAKSIMEQYQARNCIQKASLLAFVWWRDDLTKI